MHIYIYIYIYIILSVSLSVGLDSGVFWTHSARPSFNNINNIEKNDGNREHGYTETARKTEKTLYPRPTNIRDN